VLQGVKQIKGGYYFIPRPESLAGAYTSDQSTLYCRKDWARKVGITKRPDLLSAPSGPHIAPHNQETARNTA
jgi:hypothetical protein